MKKVINTENWGAPDPILKEKGRKIFQTPLVAIYYGYRIRFPGNVLGLLKDCSSPGAVKGYFFEKNNYVFFKFFSKKPRKNRIGWNGISSKNGESGKDGHMPTFLRKVEEKIGLNLKGYYQAEYVVLEKLGEGVYIKLNEKKEKNPTY